MEISEGKSDGKSKKSFRIIRWRTGR
jgi:hypothetical protein